MESANAMLPTADRRDFHSKDLHHSELVLPQVRSSQNRQVEHDGTPKRR